MADSYFEQDSTGLCDGHLEKTGLCERHSENSELCNRHWRLLDCVTDVSIAGENSGNLVFHYRGTQ